MGNASNTVSVFSALSFKKIKAGVFDGPEFCALVRNQDLVRKMNDKEKGAWFSLVAVMENFLSNKKANNYGTLVTNLLSAFHDLRCNMSVKPIFYRVILIDFRRT